MAKTFNVIRLQWSNKSDLISFSSYSMHEEMIMSMLLECCCNILEYEQYQMDWSFDQKHLLVFLHMCMEICMDSQRASYEPCSRSTCTARPIYEARAKMLLNCWLLVISLTVKKK